MHFARQRKGHLATCTENLQKQQYKLLIFKSFFILKFWHENCSFTRIETECEIPNMNSIIALATAIALTLLAGAAFANFQINQQQATATHLVQQMRATPVQFQHATNVEPGQFAAKPLTHSEWQPRPQQRFTF